MKGYNTIQNDKTVEVSAVALERLRNTTDIYCGSIDFEENEMERLRDALEVADEALEE